MAWQRDAAKERLWRRHIERWRRSGLTIRDYCVAEGLAEHSFHAWRRTLTERDRQASAAGAQRRGRRPRGFVAVQVMADEPTSRLGEPAVRTAEPTMPGVWDQVAASGTIEVVLRCGRVVRLGRGCDLQLVRQLLAVLEEPAC